MTSDNGGAFLTQETIFRKRALRCRVEAYVCLLAIFLVLIAGGVTFWTAAELASADVSRTQTVENIAIRELANEIEELRLLRRNAIDESSLNELTSDIQEGISRLGDLTGQYAADSAVSSVAFTLIQTNLTRFGTLAVVIFGAAMFLGLNRYSVRLAVFYHWQADRCVLYSEQENSERTIDKLAEASPPLDFGKLPSTPLAGVKNVANRAKGWFRSDNDMTS